MRRATGLLATPFAALFAAGSGTARNGVPVELALVLLTDASNSMVSDEYDRVKAGCRAAFSDPGVIAAVSNSPGGVGRFLVEANDYSAFGEGLKRKLLMELPISQN